MKKIDTSRWMIAVIFFSLFAVTSPHPAQAEMEAQMETEIEYLLCYIQTSGCTFNRNETIHTGEEASEHIRKKYGYAKRWIKTTEDFIKHTATKSSMSGKPYLVSCDGVEMPTAKWLEGALLRFRGGNRMMPKPG